MSRPRTLTQERSGVSSFRLPSETLDVIVPLRCCPTSLVIDVPVVAPHTVKVVSVDSGNIVRGYTIYAYHKWTYSDGACTLAMPLSRDQ